MATANSGAPLSSVPDDVLNRILVGVPLDDHRAAASACRAFRDVINGPRFLHGGSAHSSHSRATMDKASSLTGSYLSSGPPGLTFGHHRVVVCWCTTPSATRGPRTQTVPFVVAPVTRTVWRTPAPTRAALSSSCATTRHSSEAPTAPGPRSRTESEKRTVVMLMPCPDPSSSASDE